MPELDHQALTDMTGNLVVAYVAHNHVSPDRVPELISTVYGALTGLVTPPSAALEPDAEVEKPTAAAIAKSITPDALVSFVDGKPYRTLKRHLASHGMTPHDYRQRYDLPSDYPMTSPNSSAARSAIAKRLGLGKKRSA